MKRNRTPTGRGDSDVRFEPEGQGWARFALANGPVGRVRLRREPSTDRLVIVEVRLSARIPIDAQNWRRVPVGYLTQLANLPDGASAVMGPRQTPDTGLEFTVGPSRIRRPRYKLPSRSSAGRYPDGFYEGVAAAYHRAVSERVAPAQTIAEANRVPVTTVHRWIREARRRGLLPPARGKGQAG